MLNLIPDRHASVIDFLFNMSAVVFAMLVAAPFTARSASPAQQGRAGTQANALTV